ncbi:hypothetical protein F511_33618 [Dorcoceras hygrometricum]|uniref:Uncharacterized protein n=1 Tax=Dorcoceras hygrometricum TaxID=472368 RepID=A0A2Z7BVP8_9LAMI|nr:hypothetical protein F511_33618 [Dorcoceras hygrometricum]
MQISSALVTAKSSSFQMRATLLSGCPVVGREILATGSPNDWLDQTMSYQLIQTTSFAMHPRLLATDCDVTADFINADPALALLFTTAECDDITADVIIADSRFLLALCLDPTADSSSCLLIMLTSLLMSSLLIQRLILLTSSSLIQILCFLSSADLYALALLPVFLHLLIMMSSSMTSSLMVHLDVPAGSLLMFQLVHLPLLALAADSTGVAQDCVIDMGRPVKRKTLLSFELESE